MTSVAKLFSISGTECYPVYYRGLRRVLLTRFPYKVFYRIERERIIVFRALHFRQDHTRHLS